MSFTKRQVLAERAAYMRKNMTPYELKVWREFLRYYELPFVCQKVIGNYILDFYCRRVRLAIEIDGGHHFGNRQREYDERRDLFLEMLEIKVIRFSNKDVHDDFEGVCEKIHLEATRRRNDVASIPLSAVKLKP